MVATLALFAALGGSSYAALRVGSREIRDNSVRGIDLRNNDVRGADVRNGSLSGRDVKNRSLTNRDIAAETLDSRNIRGLLSSDFAPGQLPDPMPAALPAGKTLRGLFAASVTGGAGDTGIARSPISFPIPLAAPPTNQAYVNAGDPSPAQCPGTAANPQAAPGTLCVYEVSFSGTIVLRGFFDPVTGTNFRSSRFGAVAFVNGDSGAAIRGTWAVTAR